MHPVTQLLGVAFTAELLGQLLHLTQASLEKKKGEQKSKKQNKKGSLTCIFSMLLAAPSRGLAPGFFSVTNISK
jgi:hypothetical protein